MAGSQHRAVRRATCRASAARFPGMPPSPAAKTRRITQSGGARDTTLYLSAAPLAALWSGDFDGWADPLPQDKVVRAGEHRAGIDAELAAKEIP